MAGNLEQKAARKAQTSAPNRFFVENEGGAVRVSFGENWNGETIYHAAYRLNLADAVELHALLGRVLSTKAEAEN